MRHPAAPGLALVLLPVTLLAQRPGRTVEVRLGRWLVEGRATSYELRTTYPLAGPLTHGLAGTVVVHDRLGRNRAFYGLGYELHAGRRRGTLSPYAAIGAALGLSTDTAAHRLGALWSLGGGAEWRPFDWLVLGAEARYRVEDRGPRGFWRLESSSRRAVAFSVGMGLHFGAAARARADAAAPSLEAPAAITGNAASVVRTALDALGSPYRWGGTAENGFDCSGLIQYAYAQHGIRLPRRSRDQARSGTEVPPVLEALQPGDILLFAAEPGAGVTHVGLYVGEQRFIHSSSTGVRLSRLDPLDPEAAWWLPRWVGARRVIP